MKRLTALLLCLLLGAALVSCSSVSDAEGYLVHWTDSTLEEATRRYLEKQEGALILSSDLSKIQFIVIKENFIQFNNDITIRLEGLVPVSRLDDLEHFSNLASLVVADTSIGDGSPIARLPKLRQLMLYNNPGITSMEGFENLQEVTLLVLHDNGIRDFSPMLKMENLIELDLKRRHRSPIDFEGLYPSMKILKLDVGDAATLRSLASLPYLNDLDLSSARSVEDLNLVGELAGLLKLNLSAKQISDLSPLEKLSKLTFLDISNNRVSDLGPLSAMTELHQLDITRNEVYDLAPLQDMKKLVYLDAGRNSISDITPVQGMVQLRSLDLRGNNVSNLVPLEKRKSITRLNISGNPVGEAEVESLRSALKKCEITY